MSESEPHRKSDGEEDPPPTLLKNDKPLDSTGEESQETATSSESTREPDVDVIGEEEDDMPVIAPMEYPEESMRTPTKKRGPPEEEEDTAPQERIFSSFPCQVIPETLGRMTRTPPDGEHLTVHRNSNGRLRIFVVDHFKKFSTYSNLTHKPCTVCNRMMKAGEMHLNFPADLDRRRIWANLLGFKYKDILRSKMGPVSYSIAAGPICTEHFAEECFRNHNFNKAAIEAFGVPVAISPDVKTTPSKKSSRVPWVCTICDFHSCSVVELQKHLLEHTEEMLKKKDHIMDVPEAGFMCPFCRKCTYGYKTVSGYRRHLNAGPQHHCHLRRIYEFAKMNCRSTELDPVESWDNWTRRNVYVAYHGCEPPANEVVLTPSPTKRAYAQNPEERTRMVHDHERRLKAVRALSFVGKEGGTSVNDHNVMQRQVYLQIRRELEHTKKMEGEMEEKRLEEEQEIQIIESPNAPMGKEPTPPPPPPPPPLPPKRRRKSEPEEEPEEQEDPEEELSPNDPRERLRRKIRDERYAEMVLKRSQQAKRLMEAKKFKKIESSPRKARKPVKRVIETKTEKTPEASTSTSTSTTKKSVPPPPTASAPVAKNTRSSSKKLAPPPSSSSLPPQTPEAPPIQKKSEQQKVPEERPLKSMLARSLTAGVRPSLAQYHVPIDAYHSGSSSPTSSTTSGAPLSSGSISRPPGSSSPGGLFSQRVMGAVAQDKAVIGAAKRPSLLARRPLILSPRKRGSTTPRPPAPPESSSPSKNPNILLSDGYLIQAKDMEVEMVEEVIGSMEETSESPRPPPPCLTLAEALEMESGSPGVKDQEFEEISKKMMEETAYYRSMEDAMKGRTVTKMRADMRLSRHCIRQIEAARARARLFGEGTEDYHIYYSNDGAQVLSKSDPKWRQLQQPGPSE
uniref:THAP-type domain-containing protein n=1 Tax=Caenorhabditis tropicalis TaxID=1561998 RepID=A0A1I7TPP2_9PELO